MPTFDFKCEAGHVHERRLAITSKQQRAKCLSRGCGRMAKRQIGAGSAINTQPCSSNYPYVSNRLPHKLKGCRHVGDLGKPLIESRAHEDRVFKSNNYDRE